MKNLSKFWLIAGVGSSILIVAGISIVMYARAHTQGANTPSSTPVAFQSDAVATSSSPTVVVSSAVPTTPPAPSPATSPIQKPAPNTSPSPQNNNVTNPNVSTDFTDKLNLKTIQLTGKGTQGLDIDSQTGNIYVGSYAGISNRCMQGNNQGSSYLNVVDPGQGKEVAATPADPSPIWPMVDNGRGLVYLASSSGTIGVFKVDTGERVSQISVGGLPHQPAILGNIMVVSNTFDTSETYYSAIDLDTQKVIDHFPAPHLPHPVIVDSNQKIAYMMGVEKGEVVVIDMTTGQPKDHFTLEGGGGQMEISPKFNLAITDSSDPGSSIKIFDLGSKKLLDTVSFPGINTPGGGLAIDEDDGLLFVTILDANSVGVASLQTHKPLGLFKVGNCPYAVRVDSQRDRGFVTNTADATLTQFDLGALKAALPH